MSEELLLSMDEAARRLAISRRSVQSLIYKDLLASVKIGRSRRVPVIDLADYVEWLRKEGVP